MSDIRVSGHSMEQLGYEATYTLPQMIVGAIVTDMNERPGVLDLGHFDEDTVHEMGKEWERKVRQAMAGDGLVSA